MEPRTDRGAPGRAGPSRAALPHRARRGDERQGVHLRLRGGGAARPRPQGRAVHLAPPGLGTRAHRGGRRADRRGGVRRVDELPAAGDRAPRCQLLRGDHRDRPGRPRGAGRGHRRHRSGTGRATRLHQRDHAARVGGDQDRAGAHRLPRDRPCGHRPGESGHREVGRAVRDGGAGPSGATGAGGRGEPAGRGARDPGRHHPLPDATPGAARPPPAGQRVGRARGPEPPATPVRTGRRHLARELRACLCARPVRCARQMDLRRGAQSRRGAGARGDPA